MKIKKYPKAELLTCGEKDHKNGCYLRLDPNLKRKYENSLDAMVVLDLDKDGNLLGVELMDTLHSPQDKQGNGLDEEGHAAQSESSPAKIGGSANEKITG